MKFHRYIKITQQFLIEHIQEMKEWQIALPVIACLAADGSLEDGVTIASAWAPLYLASDILDDVEDKEFEPERFLPSPEVASNLATSLIFAAIHTLTTIHDGNKANQITRIFANSGLDATNGQHRDLLQTRSPVEIYLNNYWEIIILKSGSVFRAATAGGAAAGTSDEPIVEAFGDYGTALGVMLQLIDDCRDAFSHSQEAIHWEISLPLLLYLMTIGEEKIVFPEVHSQAEWADLLKKTGVIQAIFLALARMEIPRDRKSSAASQFQGKATPGKHPFAFSGEYLLND